MAFRMNKQLAADIADKLTEKKTKEIESVQLSLNTYATAEYKKYIPKAVMKAFNDSAGWISSSSDVAVVGPGFSEYKRVNFIKGVLLPNPARTNYGTGWLPETSVGNEIKNRMNKIKDMKDAKQTLRTDIIAALLRLATTGQIKQYFPEAVKYLPAEKLDIMINFAELRNKIA